MSDTAHRRLIDSFYRAFQDRDHRTMVACYHPDIRFDDPVFSLRGEEVFAMWHMFCETGKDLAVRFGDILVARDTAKVVWEADYTFSATGRTVHNRIQAFFRLHDGRIVEHRDRFDFPKWSRMAFGSQGLFLGWTPFFRNTVRKQARLTLEHFMSKHPEYAGSRD